MLRWIPIFLVVGLGGRAEAQERKTAPIQAGEVSPMSGRIYSTAYDEEVRRALAEAAEVVKGCNKLKDRTPLLQEARDKCIEARKHDAEELQDIREKLELAKKLHDAESPQADFLRHLLYTGAVVAATAGSYAACDVGASAGGVGRLDRLKICPVGGAIVGLALGVGLVW